jgi:folate-dependent phosphoribosylglycinamide formyltransferase PurN
MNYKKLEDNGSLWGGLYQPLKAKSPPGNGLRTVVFGSTNAGALVVESLRRLEQKSPDLISLTGVATDDPVDPKTRITVQKRIWKYYNAVEMENLRNKVIHTAMGAGSPCYTGGVKTDYFREIFKQWDPELIIMCCFGQKIDEFIFRYPVYGMYNFHPSDLASNIGAGPQPFQGTLKNNRKTSVMTVHQVNEHIDRGPIVGNSPEVNITKSDGSYPSNLLVLQEKIPSVCGWLGVELVLEAVKIKQSGRQHAISSFDFSGVIPESIKQILLKPATDDLPETYALPFHHRIC